MRGAPRVSALRRSALAGVLAGIGAHQASVRERAGAMATDREE